MFKKDCFSYQGKHEDQTVNCRVLSKEHIKDCIDCKSYKNRITWVNEKTVLRRKEKIK